MSNTLSPTSLRERLAILRAQVQHDRTHPAPVHTGVEIAYQAASKAEEQFLCRHAKRVERKINHCRGRGTIFVCATCHKTLALEVG